jgi:hypothetical protein
VGKREYRRFAGCSDTWQGGPTDFFVNMKAGSVKQRFQAAGDINAQSIHKKDTLS